LKPKKNSTGQRVYRRTEVESIFLIRHLLHIERYSIEGAKLRLRELRGTAGGVRAELETKVLGGAERMQAEETLKETRTVAVELKELLRRPIREIFKI
jgi:DNA-binding transcriptional MerR regulator